MDCYGKYIAVVLVFLQYVCMSFIPLLKRIYWLPGCPECRLKENDFFSNKGKEKYFSAVDAAFSRLIPYPNEIKEDQLVPKNITSEAKLLCGKDTIQGKA
ncbi:unnamed protein product [Ranitomeya imitator]|uniref:Glycoprotein hormones alpha chain n=1 Tax=Ranitomeya imitator TaxID=111125 RepID=A0ABN9LSV4_9NEOB|nr:unnamed protein product [Ranitomeya imitator]